MSLIYTLVARGRDTILSSHTTHQGNFQQVSTDVTYYLFLGVKEMQYGQNFRAIWYC
jgi:hypothetical protein